MGKHEPAKCHNCKGTGLITIYEKGKAKVITCGVCGGKGTV